MNDMAVQNNQTSLPLPVEQMEPSNGHTFRVKQVASMLNISENTVRTYEKDSGIKIGRKTTGAASIRQFTPEDVFDLAAYKYRTTPPESLPKKLTVCVYLPKGGVGKSTLATEMTVQWQLMGYRCLLVDLDPQASSTLMFGYDPEVQEEDAEKLGVPIDRVVTHTFADLFDFSELYSSAQKRVPLNKVIKMPWGANGPHLIPADITLSSLIYNLGMVANREQRIAKLIEDGRLKSRPDFDLSVYDIIVLDCAPASSVLSRAVLVASDLCVSPLRLDALSAKSLSFVSNELTKISESGLPFPPLAAVPTFFSANTTRTMTIMRSLNNIYTDSMVDAMLRQSESFMRSLLTTKPEDRMPLSLSNPTHAVVLEDLQNVAKKLLVKVRSLYG
ncbi:MAG: AAA family ATPase [Burkholderiales bacterium]|jgi:chromosome partitioning protein|nr:AAA family ATPase [Sulfuricella sp.]